MILNRKNPVGAHVGRALKKMVDTVTHALLAPALITKENRSQSQKICVVKARKAKKYAAPCAKDSYVMDHVGWGHHQSWQ